jgi:hypothetical protein
MTTKIFDKLYGNAPSHGFAMATVEYRDGKAVAIQPFFNEHAKLDASQAKHLPANIQRIMSAASLSAPASGKFTLAAVDAAFAKADMSVREKMHAKASLHRAGLLD